MLVRVCLGCGWFSLSLSLCRERDARLGTLARWFCSQWDAQTVGSSTAPAATEQIGAGQREGKQREGKQREGQSSGRLGTVVVGVARTANAYSPDAADRSIDDGWQVCTATLVG